MGLFQLEEMWLSLKKIIKSFLPPSHFFLTFCHSSSGNLVIPQSILREQSDVNQSTSISTFAEYDICPLSLFFSYISFFWKKIKECIIIHFLLHLFYLVSSGTDEKIFFSKKLVFSGSILGNRYSAIWEWPQKAEGRCAA